MEKVEKLDPKSLKIVMDPPPSYNDIFSSQTVIHIVEDKNELKNGYCEPISCTTFAACCTTCSGTAIAIVTAIAGVCAACAPIFLVCAPFIVAIVLGILKATNVI